MHRRSAFLRQWRVFLVVGLASLGLVGCISPTAYVDRALGDVPPEKMRVVGQTKPIQLLFTFDTKGALNTKATTMLTDEVKSATLNSKLFSSVATTPVPGGAVLSVKINNISLTDNAYGKGFMTGLTLGAAGSTVTDGYICTMDYLLPGGGGKITRTLRHAIHTVIGNGGTPPNSDRAQSLDEAVHIVTRQLVSNGLQQLAADPQFR